MVKLQFGIQQWEAFFPQQINDQYVLKNNHCLSYKKNLWCTSKREINIEISTDKDRSHFREISIKTIHHDLNLSTGTISATDILQKIASLYNELLLKVRYNGEIIEIINLAEIQNKWLETKSYFKNRYRGKPLQKLIKRLDNTISCHENSINALKLYEQFGLLFKPFYKQYNNDKAVDLSQKVSTVKGNVTATEKMKLQTINQSTNIVTLNINGYSSNNNITEYSGMYSLEKEVGWIKNAEIKIAENVLGERFENHFLLYQK